LALCGGGDVVGNNLTTIIHPVAPEVWHYQLPLVLHLVLLLLVSRGRGPPPSGSGYCGAKDYIFPRCHSAAALLPCTFIFVFFWRLDGASVVLQLTIAHGILVIDNFSESLGITLAIILADNGFLRSRHFKKKEQVIVQNIIEYLKKTLT